MIGKPDPASPPPLVTVVTVTLNAGDALLATMQSVLSQTHSLIDYVVIDGGSTDGSLRHVEANRARLAHVTSEPDRGVYDAMNKGIAHARGEWILFMNAGDQFADVDVVERVLLAADPHSDFVYGDVLAPFRDENVRVRARPLETMWQCIAFSHQSLFARTALMKAFPFDLSFEVTADYAFYFRQYCEGARFQYMPLTIAVIAPAGLSERRLWRRTFERWRTARTYRPCLATDLFYLKHLAADVTPLQARRLAKRSFGLA